MKDLTKNLIFTWDSYKDIHPLMLPAGTTKCYSYLESRAGAMYPYTTFFGLQPILMDWLQGPNALTKEMIDDAEPICREHFKFCGDIWDRGMLDHIVDEYGGNLPIRIKAVPEGMSVPTNNIIMDVENTDDRCAGLVGQLETLLQTVWAPSTVCTRSKYILDIIRKYFRETVDDDLQWLADYYLHDFGQRATKCMDDAGRVGMAHLVNGKGTDTKMGMAYAMKYYNASYENLGYSVPADEHSIATAEGKEGEMNVAKRLARQFPNGILSKVSDSYDITKAIEFYNNDPEMREIILARNGKFVARPDSPRYKGDTPEAQILWITQQWEKGYGSKVNSKGYKDLDPHVGTIYGDSLTEENIADILRTLKENGYSALASVFGCGGYLLQKLNRDTQRQAFKCAAQQRNGEWIDIYKEPADVTKISKKGRLKLVYAEGAHGSVLVTVPESDPRENQLKTVYENGKLLKEYSFDEVRENAKKFSLPYL